MLTTLEYNMNANQIFKNKIPKRIIKLSKYLLFYTILQCILSTLIAIIYPNSWMSNNMFYNSKHIKSRSNHDGFPYYFHIVNNIMDLILVIIGEILSFYLYYIGQNELCHCWRLKHPDEFSKYGETQRLHEIFLMITKSFIVISISAIVSIIYIMAKVLNQFLAAQLVYGYFDFTVSSLIVNILNGMDNVTSCLAIYFIYPFAENHYRKVFGKCHAKRYPYFKRRYNTNVNGKYGEAQYVNLDESKNCRFIFCLTASSIL